MLLVTCTLEERTHASINLYARLSDYGWSIYTLCNWLKNTDASLLLWRSFYKMHSRLKHFCTLEASLSSRTVLIPFVSYRSGLLWLLHSNTTGTFCNLRYVRRHNWKVTHTELKDAAFVDSRFDYLNIIVMALKKYSQLGEFEQWRSMNVFADAHGAIPRTHISDVTEREVA